VGRRQPAFDKDGIALYGSCGFMLEASQRKRVTCQRPLQRGAVVVPIDELDIVRSLASRDEQLVCGRWPNDV
jgi:hypothetical protein